MIQDSIAACGVHDLLVRVELIGSFGRTNHPSDIDVVVVYSARDENDIRRVLQFRRRLVCKALSQFSLPADVVLLSMSVTKSTKFPNYGPSQLIWWSP